MTKSIHLSLDAMGGDYAPEIVVEGAAQSKIRYPNLKFSFVGNEEKIIPLINSLDILKNSLIIHTNEFIDAADEKDKLFFAISRTNHPPLKCSPEDFKRMNAKNKRILGRQTQLENSKKKQNRLTP